MARDRSAMALGRLEKAAAKLRPIEREVLLLSARDGLSNAEIADRLGITTEAAERLLAGVLCSLDWALERQSRPWWRFW